MTLAFRWPSALNRATRCFDTLWSRPRTEDSWFRRVPLAESKHKRQPLATPVAVAMPITGLSSAGWMVPWNGALESGRAHEGLLSGRVAKGDL
jgi:hypothetical protein